MYLSMHLSIPYVMHTEYFKNIVKKRNLSSLKDSCLQEYLDILLSLLLSRLHHISFGSTCFFLLVFLFMLSDPAMSIQI